ncbi:MAG: efflux RND transporter periplasmic adaptor subunit [Deltaproteobacteria bacterium]|jgi:membrane fusion protein (multidrug efflux system)|nr:efflux RND transporter periplasmic adaptor subunit [Deltaproteobacteria bacterium]
MPEKPITMPEKPDTSSKTNLGPDDPLQSEGGSKEKTPEKSTKNGAKAVFKALLVFIFIGLIISLWYLFFRKGVEITDDAYVTGNIVRVMPQSSGTVVEILADSTQEVSEGQLLVRLDPTDAQVNLDAAWSSLKSAILSVKQLQLSLGSIEANILALEQQLALLDSEYARRTGLRQGSSVTKEEIEKYRIQVEVGKANLEAARENLKATLSLLGPGPIEEHPNILRAAAQVEAAWLTLERSRVKSPVAGKVARRSAQLGGLASPNVPLMLITSLGEIWVDANFKESQLKQIKPGMSAEVTADMLGGRVVYPAVVEGLGAGTGSIFSLLPPENATGNWIKVVQRVPVRITLDPLALEKNPLILGLSCRVKVFTERKLSNTPERKEHWHYETGAIEPDLEALKAEIAKVIKDNLTDPTLSQSALNPPLSQ